MAPAAKEAAQRAVELAPDLAEDAQRNGTSVGKINSGRAEIDCR